MRAGVIEAPGTAALVDVPVPEPGPGEILVRVEGCGVCGSSLPVWDGRDWFSYPAVPGAPGHEVWGRTTDGRRVAALSYRGFAEWDVAAEDHVVELPPALDDVPFPGEALACAVNVVRRARVEAAHRVAIVGMGFLGSVCGRLCELRGAHVTEFQRGMPPAGSYEVVIEAAGTQGALDTASALVRERGLLAIAGFHQDGDRRVDLQSWNWRGIDVVNAHERDPLAYVEGMREAVALAADGRLDVAALVTHRVALEDLGEAFDLASQRPRTFLKAVVCP